MRTDCTLSDHESIREYRGRPEITSIAKAARAYLVYKNMPNAREAEVEVISSLGQGAKGYVFCVQAGNE